MLVIVVVLITLRIAAPIIALRVINKKLAEMPEYTCHIDGIDVSIINLSVVLKGLELKKKNGKIPVPLLTCPKVYVKIVSLKNRYYTAEVDWFEANLVDGPDKEHQQLALNKEWYKLLRELPLTPDGIVVHDGEIHYRNFHKSPKIDLVATKVDINATNLENTKGVPENLSGKVIFKTLIEGAAWKAEVGVSRLIKGEVPNADLKASLQPMQLKQVNDALRAYTGFDVEAGTFSLTANIRLQDKKLSGAAVPVVRNLKLSGKGLDKEKPFGKRVAEKATQVAANIFTNKKTDRIAARVPISGTVKDPDISIWEVLVTALSTAMSESLEAGLKNPVPSEK